jgi:hypothetical protein
MSVSRAFRAVSTQCMDATEEVGMAEQKKTLKDRVKDSGKVKRGGTVNDFALDRPSKGQEK